MTKAHIEVIKVLASLESLDEVWVVPCGSRLDKPDLLEGETRLRLLQISFEEAHLDQTRIKIKTTELEGTGELIPTFLLMSGYKR